MRMTTVSEEQLREMDDASVQCAVHLSDARCGVLAYACLVAIMARGGGYHEVAEERLASAAADNGGPAPVVSSAGALIDALHALGARRTALITPYVKPLTKAVSRYIEECGVAVADAVSLEVDDNIEQELGLPVLSAATATARKILLGLGLEPTVPDAGAALSADNPAVAAGR